MSNSDAGRPVALVTGASRNIGRRIALALAEAGHAIAVHVRQSQGEGAEVVEAIRAGGGDAELFTADITDASAVHALVGAIAARWQRLDVLVNNAAVRLEAPVEKIDAAAWRHTLAVVLDGAFFCVQAALPLLRASPAGTIVNIGGMTGHIGAPQRAHVVTAKAGLAGLTRALAHELAADQITVNCVAPGLIDTERRAGAASPDPAHRARTSTLLGHRGAPTDVAAAVAWLAGPQARFITGQVLHVNGGAYLGG
jgi:3-oxoacyl-[acyl-carrier protein] reductase